MNTPQKPSSFAKIGLNIQDLREKIPESIKIVAVSKTRTRAEILEAYENGLTDFGENYLQEAIPKIESLSNYPLVWHFIGAIQANKTAEIAKYFSWVHAISREKIARRLNEARASTLAPLNVCLQINISEETSKSGLAPDLKSILKLATLIEQMPRLRLRGLMAIPHEETQEHQARLTFKKLSTLFHDLQKEGFELDTLSMGMSEDFKWAIAEGSTCVRLGTAIFGPRN